MTVANTMKYGLTDPVSATPPNTSIALLAMNLVGGVKTNFWSGPMLGATIGGGMTPHQWAYFWQDWRTFQMALGRNPYYEETAFNHLPCADSETGSSGRASL